MICSYSFDHQSFAAGIVLEFGHTAYTQLRRREIRNARWLLNGSNSMQLDSLTGRVSTVAWCCSKLHTNAHTDTHAHTHTHTHTQLFLILNASWQYTALHQLLAGIALHFATPIAFFVALWSLFFVLVPCIALRFGPYCCALFPVYRGARFRRPSIVDVAYALLFTARALLMRFILFRWAVALLAFGNCCGFFQYSSD